MKPTIEWIKANKLAIVIIIMVAFAILGIGTVIAS